MIRNAARPFMMSRFLFEAGVFDQEMRDCMLSLMRLGRSTDLWIMAEM